MNYGELVIWEFTQALNYIKLFIKQEKKDWFYLIFYLSVSLVFLSLGICDSLNDLKYEVKESAYEIVCTMNLICIIHDRKDRKEIHQQADSGYLCMVGFVHGESFCFDFVLIFQNFYNDHILIIWNMIIRLLV